MYHSDGDVNNEGACAFMKASNFMGICVSSAQFCYEPNMTKSVFKKQTNKKSTSGRFYFS